MPTAMHFPTSSSDNKRRISEDVGDSKSSGSLSSEASSGKNSAGAGSLEMSSSESNKTRDLEDVFAEPSSRAKSASRREAPCSIPSGQSSCGPSMSSCSDDERADRTGHNSLKSRMRSIFKSQDVVEKTREPDELGDLRDRVDAKLLTEVQQYDAVPSDAASYGKTSFWDERYANNQEVVEWYHAWANLSPTLTQYMDEGDEVIVCGCGNSEMSVDMYDDGFDRILNVDVSRVVIHQMSEMYKAYPMEWKSLDLTREEFAEERFDVALDKACLDSIICNTNGAARANSYLQQMDRILQPEGAFICVSFAPPEERLELLEYWDLDKVDKCLAWDVHVDAIAKPELERRSRPQGRNDDSYYVYICIKDPSKLTRIDVNSVRPDPDEKRYAPRIIRESGATSPEGAHQALLNIQRYK